MGPGIYIIVTLLVIAGVSDTLILLILGPEKTFSVAIYHLSKSYPIIPFITGVIMGHLFWPVAGG